MRSVQVIDASSGETTRAEHVIGVDESGDFHDSDVFALVAVRCPRERGEALAVTLVENDLAPWRGKSRSLARHASREERTERVRGLIRSLGRMGIHWCATVGYSGRTIHHKAAAVCAIAKRTITSVSGYAGDAVLLPDGAADMYGRSQSHLRAQAAQFFDGSFGTSFGGVYITALPKADLTYPEVTAADYIAGYLRDVLHTDDMQVPDLPDEVTWYDSNWREPSVSPSPFYRIRGLPGQYGSTERTRVVSWIKGRRPGKGGYDVSSQWRNALDMLSSDTVRQYLLEEIDA